jgi:hypothetical protein
VIARFARFVCRHTKLLLAVVGMLGVGYTIAWSIVPWRFCKDAGVVIGLSAFTLIAALQFAHGWWDRNERDGRP